MAERKPTVPELKYFLKVNGIRGYSTMKKPELLAYVDGKRISYSTIIKRYRIDHSSMPDDEEKAKDAAYERREAETKRKLGPEGTARKEIADIKGFIDAARLNAKKAKEKLEKEDFYMKKDVLELEAKLKKALAELEKDKANVMRSIEYYQNNERDWVRKLKTEYGIDY